MSRRRRHVLRLHSIRMYQLNMSSICLLLAGILCWISYRKVLAKLVLIVDYSDRRSHAPVRMRCDHI